MPKIGTVYLIGVGMADALALHLPEILEREDIVVVAPIEVPDIEPVQFHALIRYFPEEEVFVFYECERPEDLSLFGRRLWDHQRHYMPPINRRAMFSKSGYLPKKIRAIRRAA